MTASEKDCYTIVATDVFGPDPGEGKNAWFKCYGDINCLNLKYFLPIEWTPSIAKATFCPENQARHAWNVVKELASEIHDSEVALTQLFGFVPETLALVCYSSNGSWQPTVRLMDTYMFRKLSEVVGLL